MRIKAVYLRRFRGIARSELIDAAGINVLIGKNNSGKSSLLAAIEFGLAAIKSSGIATPLEVRTRVEDNFFLKDKSRPFEIGLSFDVSENILQSLSEKVSLYNPDLEIDISIFGEEATGSVVINGIVTENGPYLCISAIGLGGIDNSGDQLAISGKRIFYASSHSLIEFTEKALRASSLKDDLSAIDNIDRSMLTYGIGEGPPAVRARRLRDTSYRIRGSEKLKREIEELVLRSEKAEDVDSRLSELRNTLENDLEELENSPNSTRFQVLSETTDRLPSYIPWFLSEIGSGTTQSFKEIRPAVGREEAVQLLRLKTKRGGAEALDRLQKTVKALLGVTVDAFEPEIQYRSTRARRSDEAEMDIDDFLVEANGAGIREALRIILDLELGNPALALIEEPEVHLHPGLERVLHNYLIEKSNSMQLFVATHSSNFIDSSTRQNVYRLRRSGKAGTTIHKVASESDLVNLLDEVGVKASTILMYDRLLFVEGQSDEDIISELSRRLDIDLSLVNTAFVQMGGSSRIHHYLSNQTLDVLSRRRIRSWFVIDKDERDKSEIDRLSTIPNGLSTLSVFKRRELENYLLQPATIHSLILEKARTTKAVCHLPDIDEVAAQIKETSEELLEETVQLALKHHILRPCYPSSEGKTVEEKLSAMAANIESRREGLAEFEARTRENYESVWHNEALFRAPGSVVIDRVLSKYGFRYRKEADAHRLASMVALNEVDRELISLIQGFAVVPVTE